MTSSPSLQLDRQDLDSPAWRKIEAYLKERIAELRVDNDKELDPVATSRLRGRIAELNHLLEFAPKEQTKTFRPRTPALPE